MNKVVWVCVLSGLLTGKAFSQNNLAPEQPEKMMQQAAKLSQHKNYAEAVRLFSLIADRTRAGQSRQDSLLYVESQIQVCQCYEQLEQYDRAYVIAHQLVGQPLPGDRREEIQALYVSNAYLYAVTLIQQNTDYAKARQLLSDIMPYADEKMQSHILPKIPISWYFQGSRLMMQQRHREALPCMERAYQGFLEQHLVRNAISSAERMASAKENLYDFEGAIQAYTMALELARQTDDKQKQLLAIRGLWKITHQIGDVERLHRLNAQMDSLGASLTEPTLQFEYFRQKGEQTAAMGQYTLAEQWFLKAQAALAQFPSDQIGSNRYLVEAHLRNLYVEAEDYTRAAISGQKVIREFQQLLSPDHANYYTPYLMQADIYRLAGDREGCLQAIDTLFRSKDRLSDPKELYHLYLVRGRCHATFKDYDQALTDYRQADAILAEKYTLSDGDRMKLLALMGGVEVKAGHYAQALAHYAAYLQQVQALYGTHSLEYINAQIYFAHTAGYAGQTALGCRYYVDAISEMKQLLQSRSQYMTPAERNNFWNSVSSLFLQMTSFALQSRLYQSPFTRSAYESLLLSKAFMLDSERSIYRLLKEHGTATDLQDYMVLMSLKAQVADWERAYHQHADSIMAVSQRIQQLEDRIIGHCRGYGTVGSFLHIGYDEVKQSLSPREYLIDFTDYATEDRKRHYAAYLISNRQDCPLLQPLFSEDFIDSLGIVRPDMVYGPDIAPKVLNAVWGPLKNRIKKGSTVYYVPSQILFQVSLESLPLEDGTLLGEHYHFVRLSSARELLQNRNARELGSALTAVLYGGLQYELTPQAMLDEANAYHLSPLLVMRGENSLRGDSAFHALPASMAEVEAIEKILQKEKYRIVLYRKEKGTEESFLNMHGQSPDILHLATHGFYYTPARAESVDYLKGYTDAMFLSGLVLSGGNAAWQGKSLPEGVCGGILTAHNIARLDLSGTKMAVLSACQSGAGNVTSEGLYGLQRAFKKAGVHTLVMSLWNVSDRVTTAFMVEFYSQLVRCRWNKRKAFEKARRKIRNQYPDPFYWAGFVMLD